MDILGGLAASSSAFTRPASGEDHSLFVGDLAPDVNDLVLQQTFGQYFPAVRSAKVITDPLTGRSKGYGFVRFTDEAQRDRALTEMQGFLVSGRPVRVSIATARRSSGAGNMVHPSELDPTNTTLFIGGLSAAVSEDQLRAVFAPYGDIVYTKIPQGKGCGFVQFVDRKCAELAMAELNGHVLGGSAIRISWGRSTSRAAAAASLGAATGALGGGPAAFGMQAGYAGAGQSFGGQGYGGAGFDQAAAAAAAAGVFGSLPGAYNQPSNPFGGGPAAGLPDRYGSLYGAGSLDPYAALHAGGYGGGDYGGAASLHALAAAHQAANASSLHAAAAAAAAAGDYNPLLPADVAKLNAAFLLRQQPALLGSHLRAL